MANIKLLHGGSCAVEKRDGRRSMAKSAEILPPDMQIGLSCSMVDTYQKKTETAQKVAEKKEEQSLLHSLVCGLVSGGGAGSLSAILANADTEEKFIVAIASAFAGMVIGVGSGHISSWRRNRLLNREISEAAMSAVETSYDMLIDGKITSATAQDNLMIIIKNARDKFGLKYPEKAFELLSSGNITSTRSENVLAEMVESQYDAFALISGGKVESDLARTTLTRLIANGVEDPNEAHDLLGELDKESRED
jgi:hypothetical protein